MFKYIDCIDAGSEYCPCLLAERNECIICSQLKGKEFCDCVYWNGTCIYQEFIWNNNKSKKNREFKKYEIIEKVYLRDDIFLLKIKTTQTLARELDNIGAFVFLKNEEDSECFSTPVSILDADVLEGTITVCIKKRGIKTKALDECKKEISIKGPYLNGVQGQKFLNKLSNNNILILVRGVAGVPAVMISKKLINLQNNIYVLIDYGRSGNSYIEKYFKDLGCNIEYVSFLDSTFKVKNDVLEKIKDYINKFEIKTIVSAASDDFHKEIINNIYPYNKNINFATINNATMCCGEGVCGSCSLKDSKGNTIKSCKQQYNPVEVFYKEMEENLRPK